MNDFFSRGVFNCCCNLMMFYDWRECVMSVLASQSIPSAIVSTLESKVVLQNP